MAAAVAAVPGAVLACLSQHLLLVLVHLPALAVGPASTCSGPIQKGQACGRTCSYWSMSRLVQLLVQAQLCSAQ